LLQRLKVRELLAEVTLDPKPTSRKLRDVGHAERFIQTALREWAYATHWRDSTERNLALLPWNQNVLSIYGHPRENWRWGADISARFSKTRKIYKKIHRHSACSGL
jgi:hypothetical protein